MWTVLYRNKRFCEEFGRSPDYTDARLFQAVTVLQAYVPILLLTAFAYCVAPPQSVPTTSSFQMFPPGMTQSGPSIEEHAYFEIWPIAVLHACYVIFLVFATGVPSYFFHPKTLPPERQNAAVALSYYACGPLSLTFMPVIVLGLAMTRVLYGFFAINGAFLAMACGAAVVLLWLYSLVMIARRTMPQMKSRSTIVAVGVPLSWVALAGITLVLLPLLLLSILVVAASLR